MVKAVYEAIRDEASVWEAQAPVLMRCSDAAAGLHFTGLQWGVFAPIVNNYNEVADFVATVCAQGAAAVNDIGSDLRLNANAYEGADEAQQQAIEHVVGGY